jgi:hypothetical protein
MLTNASFLKGLTIHATDGELGTINQFYFDDETWAIRYLTVDTGGWLAGRSVLISLISILHTDWPAKRLDVSLTKKQVESSPDINTHQPVSRQHEAEYNLYYGYPFYWGGAFLWGPARHPAGLKIPMTASAKARAARIERESPIRISAVPKASPAITWERPTVKLVTWTGSSSTMKPGLSVTLRLQPGIGCPARRY